MPTPSEQLTSQLILLTRPQAYLRRVLKLRDIVPKRFADTWHSTPLQPHWATTIGMWGGVRDHDSIIKRAKVDYNVFKAFRSRHGLITRTGTLNARRPQHELALSAYMKWKTSALEPTFENVNHIASHFGILPIELRVYVDRVEHMLSELQVDPERLLSKDTYDFLAPHWAPHSDDIDFIVVSSYAE